MYKTIITSKVLTLKFQPLWGRIVSVYTIILVKTKSETK